MKNQTKNTPAQVSDLEKIKEIAAENPRIIVARPDNGVQHSNGNGVKPEGLNGPNGHANGAKPESTLKPTPDILTEAQRATLQATETRQMIDRKFEAAREIERSILGFHKLVETADKLAGFRINEGDEFTEEQYDRALFTIRDTRRQEFKFSNPILISAVLECLQAKIEVRKEEMLTTIKDFTLELN